MSLKFGKDLFKQLAQRPRRLKLIVVLGVIGMLLIMLSEILPNNKSPSEQPEKNMPSYTGDDATELFISNTELELKTMLESISGVGKCNVLVTVEGTTEYIYAEELSRYSDTGNDRTNEKYDSNIVMIEKNGEKQALVRKIIRPQINGVLIVCEGGGDIRLNERVIKAVSAALSIPSNRICVEKMMI